MRRARDDGDEVGAGHHEDDPHVAKDVKPVDYFDQEWSDEYERELALDQVLEEIAAREYPIYEEDDVRQEELEKQYEQEERYYYEENWPEHEMLDEYAAEMYGPPIIPQVKARAIAGRIRDMCPYPSLLDLDTCFRTAMWTLGDIALALSVESMQHVTRVTLTGFARGSPKEMFALGRELSQCPSLESLSLEGVALGDEGVRSLLRGLRRTTPLLDLDLRRTGMRFDGISALAYWLCDPEIKLQTLCIAENEIGMYGSQAMGFLLAHNTSLRFLNMEQCVHNPNLDPVGSVTRAFLHGLKKNRYLETLNVNCNGYTTCAVSGRLLVKALASHPSLTDIRMAGVSWAPSMMESLCAVLRCSHCHLKKLDLSDPGNFTVEEWVMLGSALGANKSLDTLWLHKQQGGGVGNQNQRSFCNGLMANKSIRFFGHGGTFRSLMPPSSLECWTSRNSIRWHRKEACKQATVAFLSIKRFHCPPWLRSCPRDVWKVLARTLMQTQADKGWKRVSGEPEEPAESRINYFLGGQEPNRIQGGNQYLDGYFGGAPRPLFNFFRGTGGFGWRGRGH